MVGWPRQEQFTVCAMQMSRRSEIVISSHSKQVQLAGPVLEGQVEKQFELFAKCPGESKKMDGKLKIQHRVVGLFRWRPCCKTLLKLSEVPKRSS